MAFLIHNSSESENQTVPVAALREGVVFPHTEASLAFGRAKSSAAIQAAFKTNKQIVLVAQKQSVNNPGWDELYTVGTLCEIENVVTSGQELWAHVKGICRVQILSHLSSDPYFLAVAKQLPEQVEQTDKLEATSKQVLAEFKKAFDLGKPVEFAVFMRLMAGVNAAELADQVANTLDQATEIKQDLLETLSSQQRLEKTLGLLVHEIKVIELEKSIATKTHAKFDKSMREQILRERKKTIEQELHKMGAEAGEEDDDEFADLRHKIKAAKMPIDIRKKAEKELSRLIQMSFNNPEANYIRTYLEWLADMPWSTLSKNSVALKKAAAVLNQDHFGLKKVKERVLESLAVMKLKKHATGDTEQSGPTILCFAGPPGVGKTSIGKSIARALGRKFVRVSLGGIRDEAEIRGHRRTYVGAMPGRIIQGIKNAGTRNPVFMLDEIDKLASDYRGDPSSALLEALDPEQNKEFSDHYLEVPFDLSQVMFITTANFLDNIPPALRDRLEIINFPGYTVDEKVNIASNYLWPKQLAQHGLGKKIKISDALLKEIASRYTREAGVREMERLLAKICRRLARQIAEGKKTNGAVNLADIHKFLGPHIYPETLAEKKDEVGMATGMAWTAAGGDILFIEVALMPGKGNLELTGQLGDVMKESAKAAWSYVRSRWKQLGLKEDFYKKLDVHIHVPEGATPKDGPSAGVTMASALVSALTGIPTRRDTSMTGEITLRGRVLEIGGVKEKVIAAHRAGIKRVILPKENRKDLIEDVPASVRHDLSFYFASHLDDVLKLALRLSTPKEKSRLSPQFLHSMFPLVAA
ncbi:MAG: endopeptidase La [bacterium]|nr:endopeptidase La [bacterium]